MEEEKIDFLKILLHKTEAGKKKKHYYGLKRHVGFTN